MSDRPRPRQAGADLGGDLVTLLSPVALSIVTTGFHGAERNKALGVWAAVGGAGSAIAVLSFIYGLVRAGDTGWSGAATLLSLLAAVVLYGAFAAVERVGGAPLMDLRMLTRRPVVAGALLSLIATALLIVFFFLGSVYGSRTTAVGGMLIAAVGSAPLTGLSHDGSVYAGLLPGLVLAVVLVKITALTALTGPARFVWWNRTCPARSS